MSQFETLLTDDAKKAILEARITQFAETGYQHELNVRQLEAVLEVNPDDENAASQIEAEQAAINTYIVAIEVNQAELAAL